MNYIIILGCLLNNHGITIINHPLIARSLSNWAVSFVHGMMYRMTDVVLGHWNHGAGKGRI